MCWLHDDCYTNSQKTKFDLPYFGHICSSQKRWVQLIMLMQNAVVKLILSGFLVLSSVEAYIIYNKKNICQKGIWILIRCHITINKNVLSASLNKTFPAFLLNLAVWLIHHGGPIGLFLIPASAPWLVCAILSVGWYIYIIESVLSCLLDGIYIIESERIAHVVAATGFLSCCWSSPLPKCPTNVCKKKCVECVIK